MSFYNNFKSILFKTKYYPISFKLNYILSSNLFKLDNKEYRFEDAIITKKLCISNDEYVIAFNKFILDKMKVILNRDNIKTESYYVNFKMHRDNEPAYLEYKNDVICYKVYYQNGVTHRLDGPASISCDKEDNIFSEEYVIEGKLHREDGPAFLYYDKANGVYSEEYYMYDTLHRDDGPAVICYDDLNNVYSEEYYQNGITHRIDGPAYTHYDIANDIYTEEYHFNGKLHRIDGPAFIETSQQGRVEQYYVDNQFVKHCDKNIVINLEDICMDDME